jgi:hypothetical protein
VDTLEEIGVFLRVNKEEMEEIVTFFPRHHRDIGRVSITVGSQPLDEIILGKLIEHSSQCEERGRWEGVESG